MKLELTPPSSAPEAVETLEKVFRDFGVDAPNYKTSKFFGGAPDYDEDNKFFELRTS